MRSLICLAVAGAMFALSAPAFAVGAIAVSGDGGREPGYGYSVRLNSREAAERRAIENCRDHGNRGCHVVVWFESCGAYATSREREGIGYGRTERRAREEALQACGSGRCQLVVSACE